nr:EOG090X0NTZ [Eulimnadia texana]
MEYVFMYISSHASSNRGLGTLSKLLSPFSLAGTPRARPMATLEYMHRQGPHIKKRPPRQPLDGAPLKKGVILKTLIKKPKKPNSANRKCVLVRLNTGKEMVAYVPKEGHNLQEHNIVLVRVGRVQDLPGVKLKCVRGVYDLGHVVKKK